MSPLDELERALRAADPCGGGAPTPVDAAAPEELRAQAAAIVAAHPRAEGRRRASEPPREGEPPRASEPRRRAGGRRRARLRPALALAVAATTALTLLVAGLPGGGGPARPGAVAAFAAQLRAEDGVLHVVLGPVRLQQEPGTRSEPPLRRGSEEVWLQLDGSGWRTVQRLDGRVVQVAVADRRGVRVRRNGRPWSLVPAARLGPGYLGRPWSEGLLVDALAAVRERRLRVAGETTLRGRAVWLVSSSSPHGLRYWIDRDGGALLRITNRIRHTRDLTTREILAVRDDRELLRHSRFRTTVQEVERWETLPR